MSMPVPGAAPSIDPTGFEAGPVGADFLASPGASILDASQAQISALRKELDSSLLFFVGMFFDYPEFNPAWHGPICSFIGRWGEPGWKRLGIQIPRDAGKTTIATRANSLWQCARDPGHNPRIGIYHANEKKAKLWIRGLREIVESSLVFQIVYADMLPPGLGLLNADGTFKRKGDRDSVPRGWRWSDAELQFNRTGKGMVEPSIGAFGVTGSNQGYHFTHIIKDDIIGQNEADSETEMQRAKEWVDTARFLESPAGAGNDLFVYTRWTYNDCYRHFREQWPDEYQIYARKALEQDPTTGKEHSSFPPKWSNQFLQAERERDPYEFNRQYQSTPQAGRETAFDPAWNRYGRVTERAGYRRFTINDDSYDETISRCEDEPKAPQVSYLDACDGVLFWDPAPSEQADRNRERNARNGKVAVLLDPWGRYLIVEATGTRHDPLPELHHTIQMAERWGISKIAVEEVNFSKVYKHFGNHLLATDPRYQGLNIVFLPQKRPRSEKDTRIAGLMPDWSAGFVYLNEGTTEQLITEAREYPFSATRDILDAFASRTNEPVALTTPMTYTQLQQRDAGDAMRAAGLDGRDAVTGY